MTNKIKSIAIGILLALTGIFPIKNANAQVNANLERINSFKQDCSYFRPNLSYNLPLEVKGFTFGEFYEKDKKDYLVKTSLDKEVYEDLGVKSQIVAGSNFDTKLGLGMSLNLPTPEKTSAKVYFLPVWKDKTGKNIENRSMLGYSASAQLPLEFKASTFGEINLNGKDGFEYAYGEIKLEKELLKGFFISYNPALKNTGVGKLNPKLEQRITAKYEFQK